MDASAIKERERRWSNIRCNLEKKGLDGLLVLTDGHIERRGSFRYVSGVFSRLQYGYAILPLKGEPILISSKEGWINDRRILPLRGGWVIESEPYASAIAEAIRELNIEKGRIGIEGDFLPFPVYHRLVKELPEATLVPSNIVHKLKMVKSAEELKQVEYGVEMVDKAYEACIEFARPGKTWNDVTSEVCRVLWSEGAEDIGGYPLSRSTEVIRTGDTYNLYPEAQAPGGHWMQFGRLLSFGEPKKEIRDAWELNVSAQQAGAGKLKPGNTGADVMKAINGVLQETKYTGAIRGSGHAVGLDIIERPFITLDDETTLEQGMLIAIHPVFAPHPGIFEACADMFVVTEGRPRRLSRISRELKIIGR